jgi:diaminohydroxyphosphoribosylaminopyrimidine deaminase/5-amino-6-(5-phosphoribosylamino)uracil reductase
VGAVLVGINTVILDNPFLTDRLVGRNNPARVVVDPKLRIPLESNFLLPNSQRIIITNPNNEPEKLKRLNNRGVEFIFLKGNYYPISLITKELGRLNIGSILVEGGAKIFFEFFSDDIYDELYLFVAPKIIGKGLGFADNIETEIVLKGLEPIKIGEDILYHVYRNH